MNGDDAIPETVKQQSAALVAQFRDGVEGLVRVLVARQAETASRDEADTEERRALNRIMAKEFCSPSEGAMMLGCSAQHLRNLADKAIKGQSDVPIPYADLEGVLTFPVKELLQWARLPKSRARKGAKNKTQFHVMAGGKQL